jgi:four helix bundle protein
MSRNPHNLQAFVMADELVVDVYRSTAIFPKEERFGLQSQIRRAAVSVATSLVEGCARRSERDYLHFVVLAIGSASEVRYLLDLAARLGFFDATTGAWLAERYGRVIRALQALINALAPRSLPPQDHDDRPSVEVRGPRPEAQGP